MNVAESDIIEGSTPTKSLTRQASLMVVEDNPLHALMFHNADKIENLSVYPLSYNSESENTLDKLREGQGIYTKAERALEVIEVHVKEGAKPPDMLLTDVELAGSMKGTQLIREIHERWPDVVSCMIYSSDVKRYEGEIGELKEDGLIIGSWYKGDFSLDGMVDMVNPKLEKRTADD